MAIVKNNAISGCCSSNVLISSIIPVVTYRALQRTSRNWPTTRAFACSSFPDGLLFPLGVNGDVGKDRLGDLETGTLLLGLRPDGFHPDFEFNDDGGVTDPQNATIATDDVAYLDWL